LRCRKPFIVNPLRRAVVVSVGLSVLRVPRISVLTIITLFVIPRDQTRLFGNLGILRSFGGLTRPNRRHVFPKPCMISLEVWVRAPVELSEVDMTVCPGSHNARDAARVLYGRGLPVDAIAQTLKVSVMSIPRWRQQDMEAGMPWAEPPQPQSADPEAAEPQLRQWLRSRIYFAKAPQVARPQPATLRISMRTYSVEGAFLECPRPAVATGDSPRRTWPSWSGKPSIPGRKAPHDILPLRTAC